MLVDVAIQSYKKPESLIYTLLTLKDYCGKHIEKIYINDDCSQDGTIEYYYNAQFIKKMNPITIVVRENNKRAGLYFFEKKMLKKFHNILWFTYYKAKNRKPVIIEENDIRYQWAINQTDKKYIYITHDDVEFRGDVIGEYLANIDDNPAIVGELGQCWRCPLNHICDPAKINNGEKPNSIWPRTSLIHLKHKRDCRINEWSCMINVEIARQLSKDSIYFGAFEDLGDTGAYWFDYVVDAGLGFKDPIGEEKESYYQHCWQGFAGFQTDIYGGENKYDKGMIRDRIANQFGLIF